MFATTQVLTTSKLHKRVERDAVAANPSRRHRSRHRRGVGRALRVARSTLVDAWGCDDADYIVVVPGLQCGANAYASRNTPVCAKKACQVGRCAYRASSVRSPRSRSQKHAENAKGIAVIDRSDSFGSPSAPLALEVRNALYRAGLNIPVSDYIAGLGGADITLDQIKQVYTELEQGGNSSLTYLGVEE